MDQHSVTVQVTSDNPETVENLEFLLRCAKLVELAGNCGHDLVQERDAIELRASMDKLSPLITIPSCF